MTRLHLVDDAYLANQQQSVRVAPSLLSIQEIADLEQIVQSVYMPASKALADLVEGLADRDVHKTVVALRRLVAVGGLAQPAANRFERTLRV